MALIQTLSLTPPHTFSFTFSVGPEEGQTADLLVKTLAWFLADESMESEISESQRRAYGSQDRPGHQ